mgnify:CR=1 FL=1
MNINTCYDCKNPLPCENGSYVGWHLNGKILCDNCHQASYTWRETIYIAHITAFSKLFDNCSHQQEHKEYFNIVNLNESFLYCNTCEMLRRDTIQHIQQLYRKTRLSSFTDAGIDPRIFPHTIQH